MVPPYCRISCNTILRKICIISYTAMQCDPHCSDYKACTPACAVETCDNFLDQGIAERMCNRENCLEGCHIKPCEDGFIYLNDTYRDCVPKADCKPVCMVKEEGRSMKATSLIRMRVPHADVPSVKKSAAESNVTSPRLRHVRLLLSTVPPCPLPWLHRIKRSASKDGLAGATRIRTLRTKACG